MRAPLSEEDVRSMLDDRPERTQTRPTSREVIAVIPADSKVELRTLGDDETKQLADYLGVDPSELDGPFQVVEASCEGCGRQLTFLDFVQTAVDEGAHEREQLRDVLTGRAGAWITIRGQDGGRGVTCIVCGMRRSSDYSEYSSSSYAYA
jgi:hypothetical protein